MLEPDYKVVNPYRMKNPLAKFSSYTYSLTFGMFDPEGYNYYTTTGELPRNDAASGNFYVVSQSGGIDNAKDKRALSNQNSGINEGLDVYIDNLNFETSMLAYDGSNTATFSSKFTFEIIEPIGFTLLTRLANLSNFICKNSIIINSGNQSAYPSLYQQQYILIIKFYGYDANGNLIDAASLNNVEETIPNDRFAVHTRVFPLMVNKVGFKISGKSTTYAFEAESPSQRFAFGSKRGIFVSSANIEGKTVGEILGDNSSNNDKSLIGWLNAKQRDLKINQNISEVQRYNIEWVSNSQLDTTVIKNSSLMTNSEIERETSGMANDVYNTMQVNVKSGSNARTVNPVKMINIPAQTPIISVIDNVILKSKYVAGTLTKEVSSQIESATFDSSANKLVWYAIKPVTKITGRDDTTKDWVCDITYEITPYEVPFIRSQYVAEKTKYYGPVKKYDYVFTGSNTEVIDFNMTVDNLFYMPIPASTTADASSKKNNRTNDSIPRAVVNNPGVDPNGGSINKQSMIADSVRANLYSIADNALAEIRIMGDPDLIMSSVGHKTLSDSFSKLYAKNGSISPYSGQIFVEISFKIAEDYKNNGLLDVDNTQTVTFYTDKVQEQLKPEGLIFLITRLHNTFSRGKFEQTLSLRMAPLSEFIVDDADSINHETAKLQRQQSQRSSQIEKEVRANQTDATRKRLQETFGYDVLSGSQRRIDDPRRTDNTATGWTSSYSKIYSRGLDGDNIYGNREPFFSAIGNGLLDLTGMTGQSIFPKWKK